jgi:dTDP-L-rhamnose 4-epimerase
MIQLNADFISGKDILVTGGAGFIGCALSHILAKKCRRYVAVDNLHPQIHAKRERPAALNKDAELIIADIVEEETWDNLLTNFRPQIIIHLAAETGTGQSLTEASRHSLVNVVGTTRMTDALTRNNVSIERILLTGSRAVYGEGAWKDGAGKVEYPGQRSHVQLEAECWDFDGLTSLPSRADLTEPRPTSVYGATKLAQEQVLKAWSLATKTPLTVLRLQNVYGSGQSLTNSYTGIVSLFSRLAREGKAIPLYEDGLVTRDFVWIEDVIHAIVAALELRPVPFSIFDIGSGQAVSIADMAKLVAAYYGAPEPRVTKAFRDGDVRHAACDLNLTLSSLNWQPKWSLENGISKLQEWIASELDSQK